MVHLRVLIWYPVDVLILLLYSLCHGQDIYRREPARILGMEISDCSLYVHGFGESLVQTITEQGNFMSAGYSEGLHEGLFSKL